MPIHIFLRFCLGIFGKNTLRILRLLKRPLQMHSLGVFILMIVQSLSELAFILILTQMGTALTNSDALRQHYLYQALFALFPNLEIWSQDSRHLLLVAGIMIVIVCAIKNIINYITAKSIAQLGEDISCAVGQEMFWHFLMSPYTWHLSAKSAILLQRIRSREQVGTLLMYELSMYTCVLTQIILLLALMGQEPVLTTLVIGITSLIGIFLYAGIRKRVDKNAQLRHKNNDLEHVMLNCADKGIREVLIYRQQNTFMESFTDNMQAGRQSRTFSNIASTIPTWVLESVGFCLVIGAILFLTFVQQADTARITNALLLLVLTAWRVLPYGNRVVSLQIAIRDLMVQSNAVLDELEYLRAERHLPLVAPALHFQFQQDITLHDICFRYAGTKHDTLQSITLRIPKGSHIGIIGSSGAGKSTLAGIISGLIQPAEGHITVDGQPLSPAKAAALASHTGYVPQHPFIFAGTLAENITFSEWGKTPDKERLHEACQGASIDFVDTHPDGLALSIGENGNGLSGGQAQRVSIARALYARPSLLIFDEATSSLDQGNENSIQQTIATLAKKTTCVIIAHRLSTVAHCDHVIWMEKGRIHMQGPPEKILPLYERNNIIE